MVPWAQSVLSNAFCALSTTHVICTSSGQSNLLEPQNVDLNCEMRTVFISDDFWSPFGFKILSSISSCTGLNKNILCAEKTEDQFLENAPIWQK